MPNTTTATSETLTVKDIVDQYCQPKPGPKDQDAIDGQIRKLEAVVSDAFGIESEGVAPIQAELERLKNARSTGYPVIDLSFISTTLKRTKTGALAPAFAVFLADSNQCSIEVTLQKPTFLWVIGYLLGLTSSYVIGPVVFPEPTGGQILEVVSSCWGLGILIGFLLSALLPGDFTLQSVLPQSFDRLLPYKSRLALQARSRWSPFNSKTRLSTKFAGLIPASVRKQMQSESRYFDELLLVTEAHDWALNTEPLPIQLGDLLLVGRKGDVFFLLNQFDTTPAELWMASANERP